MLKEYLENIKDLTTEDNELMHRPSLYNLLNRLKDHFNKECNYSVSSKLLNFLILTF